MPVRGDDPCWWAISDYGHRVLVWTGDRTTWARMLELLTDDDLPGDMSFEFATGSIHFATREERLQWAAGFTTAWHLMADERDL